MQTITFADAKKSILNGDFDGNLDEIRQLVSSRKAMIDIGQFHAYNVGEVATIVRSIRPKYLAGLQVRIKDKRDKNLVCDLVVPQGCRFDRGILLKPTHLTR